MTSHRVRRCIFGLLAGLIATYALLPTGGAAAAPRPVDGPAPVESLDLNQYLGTWNQLAAVPQFFNLQCARDTRADYTLDPQGNIAVYNSCTTWSGDRNEIRGTAKVNDPVTRAQFHVSFPSVPGQGQLDGPTNYIVTALGPDYSWALVTDPTRLSGFVLARSPALDAPTWDRVREAITAAGQTPCMYLTSPVTDGQTDLAPLCLR